MDGSSDMGEFGFSFNDISNDVNFDIGFVDISSIDVSSDVFEFFLDFDGLLGRGIFLGFHKSFVIRKLSSDEFLVSISFSGSDNIVTFFHSSFSDSVFKFMIDI